MHWNRRSLCCAAVFSFLLATSARAQSQKPPTQNQKPPIQITVDLSDVPRKLFHAEIDLPVTAGPVTLITPKWIPGDHRPTGPVDGIINPVNGGGGAWADPFSYAHLNGSMANGIRGFKTGHCPKDRVDRPKRKRRPAEYNRRAALVRRGRVLKSRQTQLAIHVPPPYDPNWDSLRNGYGSGVVLFGTPHSHRS